MITSNTITARSPVAACKSSAGMLSLSELTIRTAMSQVIRVATKAMPAPAATGRRYARFFPVMLAVIAASTRMHSRPSRNTRTPMSRNATVGLVFGCVGSGAPWATIPCHTITAATQIAAAIMPMRNANFIQLEIYHIGFATAAVRLLFFSGSLRAVALLKSRI